MYEAAQSSGRDHYVAPRRGMRKKAVVLSESPEILRCAYCSWSYPKWRIYETDPLLSELLRERSSGAVRKEHRQRKVSGFQKRVLHVMRHHAGF